MSDESIQMQVSVESLGGLQRKMTVQVPAEQIDSEVDKRLKRVTRTVKMKGFRPGKVPYKVVQQRYGGEIRREVLGDLMQSSYAEAVSQEKLQPAGGPRIQTDGAEAGNDLEFTATFEIYPEVELKKTEGLKIERPVAGIGDEDVDRVLENLREQRAHWHAVERAAKEGDQVTVDFKATIDGEAFPGNEADDFAVELGAGQMPEEFEQALTGASAGDEVTKAIPFPADHPTEAVAGKSADFIITVKKVSEKHLPEIDEGFCASFGVDGGVDALRDGIRDNMQRELDDKIKGSLREQVLNQLIEKNPVDLPQTLIDQEVDYLRGDAARRMGIEDPEQMPAANVFEEPARRRVALGLVVARLVEEAGIEADNASVEARLQQMVSQFGEPEPVLAAYRKDPRLMGQIEMAVVEEKAVDWLIEHAKIKDKKKPFQEVMAS